MSGAGLILTALLAFVLLKGNKPNQESRDAFNRPAFDPAPEFDDEPGVAFNAPEFDDEPGVAFNAPEFDDEPGVAFNYADMTPITGNQVFLNAGAEQNVAAFLRMLQSSEHVYPRDVENGAAYGIFYGGTTFSNFADHPVNTGEKVGVKLSNAQCGASGFKPGCVSTAAGAYQFIKPTWDRIRAQAPRLPDFSPASQDAAAVRLLANIGALGLIQSGNIAAAVMKSSATWASLPGSLAQQNPRQMAFLVDRFNESIG